MAKFCPLSDGIFCLDALYVDEQIASIYLIQQGDEAAIIETGTYHSVANVIETLDQLNIPKNQIKYVIPTHVHLDHAGGASEMMRQFEQAKLLIHPRGLAHMVDPQKLISGTVAVYGQETFDRLYGRIDPIDEARIQVMPDSSCVSLQDRKLLFIDTPGHARHHFCIYDETSEGMFTGDSFGISYSAMKALHRGLIPTTPPTQFDPVAMHETVDRIMSYNPRRLYLTHYGEFIDPGTQIDSFHRWIDTYVELTNRARPTDETSTQALEQNLTRAIIDELSDTRTPLDQILKIDLGLNAQGLAWWWQRSHSG